jgi:coenzyme F420-reducing hydrogenase alpha subunit
MDEEREEHLEQLRVDAERAQRHLDAFRNLLSDRLHAANARIKTLLLHGSSAEEKAQARSDRSSIQAQLQQKEQWAELRIKEYLDTKEEFQVSIISPYINQGARGCS